MERDFSKPLSIVIAGTGKTSMPNLKANLDEWIFGNPEDNNERFLRVIIPVMADLDGSMRGLVDFLMDYGPDEVSVWHVPGAGMTSKLAKSEEGKTVFTAEDPEHAFEAAMAQLKDCQENGDETAFLMLFNEESVYTQGETSPSDLELIGMAKNYSGIPTLNLCEGLVDSFNGFETPEERAFREKLEAEQKEKEAAERAAEREAKKAAAKKTTTASAPVEKAPERTHELGCTGRKNHRGACTVKSEPEKPLAGLDKLISDSVTREEEKREDRKSLELSATVSVGHTLDIYDTDESPWDKGEEIANNQMAEHFIRRPKDVLLSYAETSLTPVTTEDVWADVAKSQLKQLDAAELLKHCTMSQLSPEQLQVVRESGIYTEEEIQEELAMGKAAPVLSREDELVIELAEGIGEMGAAMSKTVSALIKFVQERK